LDEKSRSLLKERKRLKEVNREKNLYGAVHEYENLNTEKEIMETVVGKIEGIKSAINLILILVEFNLSKV